MDEQALVQLIRDRFLSGQAVPIAADANLLEEGILDSLALVQMAAALEERCTGLRIRDQDITHANFASVGAILRFLAKRGFAAAGQ